MDKGALISFTVAALAGIAFGVFYHSYRTTNP